MNPITKFESTARQIWNSTLDAGEKAIRLRALGKGIEHYIGRIPTNPSEAKAKEPFNARARERVVKYLELLAKDIESLATLCQGKTAAVAITGVKRSAAAN